MKPTIQHLTNKQLIGMSEAMSLVEDKTGQLFRTFMPRRKEIPNLINADTFDLRVYPEDYYQPFNPTKLFTKWALAEVSKVEAIPEGMEVFHLIGGQYAVFHYKGLSSDQGPFLSRQFQSLLYKTTVCSFHGSRVNHPSSFAIGFVLYSFAICDIIIVRPLFG